MIKCKRAGCLSVLVRSYCNTLFDEFIKSQIHYVLGFKFYVLDFIFLGFIFIINIISFPEVQSYECDYGNQGHESKKDFVKIIAQIGKPGHFLF